MIGWGPPCSGGMGKPKTTTVEWVKGDAGEVLRVDGSGAPALVRVQGILWACDILGVVKVRRVMSLKGDGPKAPRWMMAYVEKTYTAALKELASPEWMALNAAMYEVVRGPS